MQDHKKKAIEFVERVNAGDKLAESDLVEFYGPGLLLMLEQRVHDRQLAADLYQDTFLIVIQRLRQRPLEEPNKLGGFIQIRSPVLPIPCWAPSRLRTVMKWRR